MISTAMLIDVQITHNPKDLFILIALNFIYTTAQNITVNVECV